MDSRHAGTTPKCFAKLAPNGMVSCFTSLPAAPVAVEEMVFFFFLFNFTKLDGIVTKEIIPGTQ